MSDEITVMDFFVGQALGGLMRLLPVPPSQADVGKAVDAAYLVASAVMRRRVALANAAKAANTTAAGERA